MTKKVSEAEGCKAVLGQPCITCCSASALGVNASGLLGLTAREGGFSEQYLKGVILSRVNGC